MKSHARPYLENNAPRRRGPAASCRPPAPLLAAEASPTLTLAMNFIALF